MEQELSPSSAGIEEQNRGSATVAIPSLTEVCMRFENAGRELLRRNPAALLASIHDLLQDTPYAQPLQLGANHPLAPLFGKRQGQPQLDSLMERVEEYRRSLEVNPPVEDDTAALSGKGI